MKLFPREEIIFRSHLKDGEILDRLTTSVEQKDPNKYEIIKIRSRQAYFGLIVGNKFTIKRTLQYRNSFQPIIEGIFESQNEHTIIRISMKPSENLLAFMGIWFSFIFLAIIALLISSLLQSRLNPFILLPIGMFLFAYLIITFGFKIECNQSKQDLKKILKATSIE